MTATISQADAILALLQSDRWGITPKDALEEVGCFRLAARIAELRAAGNVIYTKIERRDGKRYARYTLARCLVKGCGRAARTPQFTGSVTGYLCDCHVPISESEQRALWGDR